MSSYGCVGSCDGRRAGLSLLHRAGKVMRPQAGRGAGEQEVQSQESSLRGDSVALAEVWFSSEPE